MIALHDCNGDVNRAINVLLEGSPDTVSSGLSLEVERFVFVRETINVLREVRNVALTSN